MNRGYTLVEVLVVATVIAVLVGVIFPTLELAKRSAYKSVDISNLHQLGLAQELYSTDTGAASYETLSLVQGGYVSSRICQSPLDTTSAGIANMVRATDQSQYHSQTSYFDSYVTVSEVLGKDYVHDVVTSEGGGWAVSLGEGTTRSRGGEGYLAFDGSYLRLFDDGHVMNRQQIWKRLADGSEIKVATWMFTDETERFAQ